MPNWVENDLRIWCSSDDNMATAQLNEFIAYIKTEGLDFGKIIPYPKEYEDADRIANEWDSKYAEFRQANPNGGYEEFVLLYGERPIDGYNQGGYDWCIDNWGTKWTAKDIDISDLEDWGYISFDTAWSPPVKVIIALSKKYPLLNFGISSFECGMARMYGARIVAGVVVTEGDAPYFGNRGG